MPLPESLGDPEAGGGKPEGTPGVAALEPISAPVEMEASDGQAGEREEQVKWGWAREGGRKEGRGWLGKGREDECQGRRGGIGEVHQLVRD